MSPVPDTSTKARVLDAAMALFGRQGFHATTVAQIEKAAGLSAGAGGLYRHFPSKTELLAEGLRRQIATAASLTASFQDTTGATMHDRLVALARASLRRLHQERDLNRLLLRDLADFPELLAQVRDSELRRVHAALTGWLQAQTPPPAEDRADDRLDAEALAAVLMGAVSHYWIMTDVFAGSHPFDVDADRYLDVLATMAAALLR